MRHWLGHGAICLAGCTEGWPVTQGLRVRPKRSQMGSNLSIVVWKKTLLFEEEEKKIRLTDACCNNPANNPGNNQLQSALHQSASDGIGTPISHQFLSHCVSSAKGVTHPLTVALPQKHATVVVKRSISYGRAESRENLPSSQQSSRSPKVEGLGEGPVGLFWCKWERVAAQRQARICFQCMLCTVYDRTKIPLGAPYPAVSNDQWHRNDLWGGHWL